MLMDEKKRLSNRTKLENVNSIFMNKVEHFVPIELFIKLDAPWQVCPPPPSQDAGTDPITQRSHQPARVRSTKFRMD